LTRAQCQSLGMPAWVIESIDVNCDGKLSFGEILAWIKTLQP
jgi:hypothetical protein